MKVVRTKVKLIDKKEGTVHVFLTGLPQNISEWMDNAFQKFADPESRFGFVTEFYVAEISLPQKKAAAKDGDK